jgi:Beta-lactamase enzyme family
MRRLAVAIMLAALASPASAGAQSWQPDVAGAAAWAAQRQGTVTFAVRVHDRLYGHGLDRQAPTASVLKAMLMTAYLRQRSVRDRPLGDGDRALLRPMIRRSDNVTATRIRDIVGNGALVRLARRVGMTRFAVNPVWGLSLTTARDQTLFFLRLEDLLPDRHEAYALRLLRTIVPSQRWGMGQTIPDGWTLHFKGGWGSGTGAVDHQVGLLRRGEDRVAIAVMTVNNPSHAYGKATLEGVSRRLLAELGPVAAVGPSERGAQFSR